MEKSMLSGAVLVFVALSAVSCVSGLDCYECNLNLCSRDTGNATECMLANEYQDESNDTQRQEIWDKMQKIDGCTEKTVSGCLACTKVITETRRIFPRGVYRSDIVLSKVCALSKPDVEEDTCFKSGPSHARQYLCHCFNDLCNSALSRGVSSLTVFASLINLVLCSRFSS